MNTSQILIIVAILSLFFVLKKALQARADVARTRAAGGALVLDVRTRAEYERGQLPHALNVPLNEIKERIAEIAPDKGQPILLHCASGARSEAAKRILRGMGYVNVHNIGSYARARALLASD